MVLALNSAIALLVLAAAAAAAAMASLAPMIGLEGCKTSCGEVGVPYPFGLGPARCYWPGFNLTCRRSGRGPPRLLLGDGTLEVINISLTTTIPTVHVIRTGPIIDDDSTPNFTSDGLPLFPFGTSFAGSIYTLYTFKNELFLFGCNLTVMLVEDINESNPKISAGCTSICSPDLSKYKGIVKDKLCFGIGCCQAEIAVAPRNFSDFLRGVPTNGPVWIV